MGRKGIIIALVVAFVAGFAGFSIAYQGGGCPYKGKAHGNAANTEFDEAVMAKITEERERFLQETADLRQQRHDKARAVGEELAKDTPDRAVAEKLQTELSELDAEYDQKRLVHKINMKKIDPRLEAYFSGYHGKKAGCGYAKKAHCDYAKKAQCPIAGKAKCPNKAKCPVAGKPKCEFAKKAGNTL